MKNMQVFVIVYFAFAALLSGCNGDDAESAKNIGPKEVVAQPKATTGDSTGSPQRSWGQVVEFQQAAAYETRDAEKKFGYVIESGAFSVQVKADGKGMIYYGGRFYDSISLKYLRYGVVATSNMGPFPGPYYEANVGNTTLRILFSSVAEDVHGRYLVFYADKDDRIFSRELAYSRSAVE
jgi:hypothetical protein